MEVNLSEQTIETIYNSLRCSKQLLKEQVKNGQLDQQLETIYVDTGNMTVSTGTLDSTPKTGDGIHPKWFLSIGLACISIILFTSFYNMFNSIYV